MNKYFRFSPIQSRINFTALDCLRGLAAVYVVINHCRGNLYAGGNYLAKIKPVSEWSFFEKAWMALLQSTSLGHEFVIFFFILSGFSIAFSIHRTKEIKDFYKRRLLRIYPPYLLGIIWAIAVLLLVNAFAPAWLTCTPDNFTAQRLCNANDMLSFKSIIANFFYFPNGPLLPQYWSLPHEIIFYAAIPLFIRSVKAYIIVSVILFFGVIPFDGITFMETGYKSIDYIIHYNFYFAVGVYLFYYGNLISDKPWTGKHKPIFFLVFVLIFLIMVITKFIFGDFNFVTEILITILSVICIKYFLNTDYTPKLLVFFGKFSYTIYIGHFAAIYLLKLLMHLFFNYNGEEIINKFTWIIGVVFALLCCYILYFIAEKPSKEALNKLRKK